MLSVPPDPRSNAPSSLSIWSPAHPHFQYYILFLACIIPFGAHVVKYSLSSLESEMLTSPQFPLTHSEFGWFAVAVSFPNSFVPIIGGAALDFYGTAPGALVLLFITLVGHAGFVLSCQYGNFFWAVIGRAIFGLGQGSVVVVQGRIIARWFQTRELVFAIALSEAFHNGANVLAKLYTVPVSAAAVARPDLWTGPGYVAALWVGVGICALSALAGILFYIASSRNEKWNLEQLEEEEEELDTEEESELENGETDDVHTALPYDPDQPTTPTTATTVAFAPAAPGPDDRAPSRSRSRPASRATTSSRLGFNLSARHNSVHVRPDGPSLGSARGYREPLTQFQKFLKLEDGLIQLEREQTRDKTRKAKQRTGSAIIPPSQAAVESRSRTHSRHQSAAVLPTNLHPDGTNTTRPTITYDKHTTGGTSLAVPSPSQSSTAIPMTTTVTVTAPSPPRSSSVPQHLANTCISAAEHTALLQKGVIPSYSSTDNARSPATGTGSLGDGVSSDISYRSFTWRFILLCLLHMIFSNMNHCFGYVSSDLLHDKFNSSAAKAAWMSSLTYVMAMVLCPLASLYLDRVGYKMYVCALCAFISGLAFTLLAVMESEIWAIASLLILAVPVAIVPSVVRAAVPAVVDSSVYGIAYGVYEISEGLGAVLGHGAVGFVRDRSHSYDLDLFLFIGMAAAALIAALALSCADAVSGGTLDKPSFETASITTKTEEQQRQHDDLLLNH